MFIVIAGIVGLISIFGFGYLIIVSKESHDEEDGKTVCMTAFGVLLVGMLITLGIAIGCPKYLIWQQEQEGAAELAKAEQNRQIAIQEAKAKEESAKSLANADIIRAEGVAKANEIIGNSLKNNDAYIHYLWIEALKESKDQVIYIPTEAGIPVTESARFVKRGE